MTLYTAVSDLDYYDEPWEDRPAEPSEADDRNRVARCLRSIREQIQQMGPSTVTCELLREYLTQARLLQCFRRADLQFQRSGRPATDSVGR